MGAKRLISVEVEGKVSRYAQGGFQDIPMSRAHPRRPQTGRIGECRAAATVGDSEKGKASAEAPLSRSSVLDIAHEDLGKMENGARDRTTCYCPELASATIQAVLVEALPEQWTGPSASRRRSPEVGSNNGCRERDVGRAANSW